MTVFGIVSLVLAVWGNLGHLLFTVWVSAEQLKTGWGYGTDMEMAVLMPWLVEVLCIPAFIIGATFLVLSLKKPVSRVLRRWCVGLYAVLLLQIVLTNFFIHM